MRFCTGLESIGAIIEKQGGFLIASFWPNLNERTKFDKEVNLAEEWFAILGYLLYLKKCFGGK
jgi:hypothetical protein